MNFPSQIFSIGGAGKEIAFRLLESDWVLRDILEPRPNPQSVTVTIIDTAEGEQNTDKQRVQEIRKDISELEDELRDPQKGRTGTIDVEYKLITEEIQLSGSIDLLGNDAVPRIAAGNGMEEENWWIQEQHINENLDFAKGVVRKRGLGKAIYYKAYAEDDSISTYIDLPTKGKVAVLCGLGGGTGSGILIDLARHLQQQHRTAEITLFGVLPNHTEGVKENTNAFAALTELEYVNLQGENIFKDMVLLPIDPTNFDGKTGNRIQTDKYLNEFDDAVIYLLGAYYNTEGLEDPFADTPDYAPFTIGIPQVLRYNVEAINDAREAIREILDDREKALQVEKEVYSQIDRFLTRHYDEDPEPGLRDLDVADLSDRIEEVESLLEFDLFEELNYETLAIFNDVIDDAKEESNDVVEQVEYISASVRAVDAANRETGSFTDNIDEHLAQIINQDLELLGRRKELLERRKVIDDNRIRDAIEYIMRSGDGSAAPGVKLQRLEAKVDDATEQRDRIETDLTEVEQELEAARNEQSEEVQRQLNDWERSVSQDIQVLQDFDDEAIQEDLNSLTTLLDRYLGSVMNAASEEELEQLDRSEISNTLDRIQAELDTLGQNFQDQRRNIEASMTQLSRAKAAFLQINQEEGTIEKLTPWESSTEEAKQEAHKDYRVQKGNLSENGVFEVGTPSGQFAADVTFDPNATMDSVRRQRQELVDRVSNELRSRVSDFPEERGRSLETALTDETTTKDQIVDIAEEVFESDIIETGDLQSQKRELESELEDVEARLNTYQPAIDLFQNLNNRREEWDTRINSFRSNWSEYEDDSQQQVATEEEDYVYVKNIRPSDVFSATGNDSIAESDFFSSPEENQRVRENLEELSRNARNQKYTGLRRRKLAKGRKRYDNLKVRLSVMSPAINHIDNEAIDFQDMFSGAFDLGGSGKRAESPYTSWSTDIGGPWDVGLGIFINGVFLDNIRKFVQADGYQNGYQNQHAELGDDILIHHSYGLEEGYYVRRTDHLNMEYDDDIEFYLRDEGPIVEDLLEDYYERITHANAARATETDESRATETDE